jgi:hypothetical protein
MVTSGLKRIAVAAALALSVGLTGAARAATMDADIMFVVDGSGSMGDDFIDLGKGMTTFVNGLKADPRVGSVRVGLVRYSLNPVLDIAMTDDLTVFDGLTRRKGNFSTENPLMAIDFAVNSPDIKYRPDAVKTLILITDEEGNDFGTYKNAWGTGGSATAAMLKDMGFLNNVIHNPGKKGSTENYGTVALPYGALFDIMDFRADPMGFLEAFAKVKVKEFADVRAAEAVALTPMPLPAGAWLLLGGLGAMAALRRRKAA